MTGCGQADRRLWITNRPLSQLEQIGWPCIREPAREHAHYTTTIREPWNKGKLVGQKAGSKLVPFEITEPTREAVGAWIGHAGMIPEDPVSDLDPHSHYITLAHDPGARR